MKLSDGIRRIAIQVTVAVIGLAITIGAPIVYTNIEVARVKATVTAVIATLVVTPSPVPDSTPTLVPLPTVTPGAVVTPYPAAPLCPDSGDLHDTGLFHTLWDSARGCHYSHEHGRDPFTPEVAAAFPGMDLYNLLGGVGVGHTNLSGATENTIKHAGFFWNVQLQHPAPCAPFEGSLNGVSASAIQVHGYGDKAIELEAAYHSLTALLAICNTADPGNPGFFFTTQHVSYGENILPYQGDYRPYPYDIQPTWDPKFGMYVSSGCVGNVPAHIRGTCRATLQQAQQNAASSTWAGNKSGTGPRPPTSGILNVLWRSDDDSRVMIWSDTTHPYTWLWLCTSDGGATYNPVGCEYNNTTPQVHEVEGQIPAAWNDVPGLDTQPGPRITAEGYTTRFGVLAQPGACLMPGLDCHPFKAINLLPGRYGSVLVYTPGKGVNVVPYLPDRDIYFCGQQVCAADAPGAVPSGWVSPSN